MRFSIYKHPIVIESTGEIYYKHLIVVKDNKQIVKWTNFHKYIKAFKNSIVHKNNESIELRAKNIVKMLNYLFFDQYKINKLSDITVDMISNYLNDYGLCNLPGDNEETHRKESTVELCILHVMDFLTELIRDKDAGIKFKEKDLYREGEVWSTRKRTFVKKKVPIFTVNVNNSYEEKIFRDIPTDAFAIIMNNIYFNHPRILMIAACSAFAGLRPSEACNLRRIDSALGPGIMIDKVDDEIRDITLDLRYEFNLRSDGVNVGGIKKHRKQRVYHPLIQNWIACYNRYNFYNQGRKYEAKYGPLSVNNNGMAMTYQSYYDEFRKAVKECIPEMLADDNPEIVFYGNMLATHKISPHILRHWFSVHLVLDGAEINDLMNWRGDKSPESAQTYINNKSDILRKHNQVAEETFNFLYWKANKKWNS